MSSALSTRAIYVVPLAAGLAVAMGAGVVYTPLLTFAVTTVLFMVGLLVTCRPLGSYKQTFAWRERLRIKSSSAYGYLFDRAVSVYLLGLWLALIAPLATLSPMQVGEEVVQVAEQGGGLLHRVLIFSYGAVGGMFLISSLGHLEKKGRRLLLLWAVYLLWGGLSLFWSVDLGLSTRQLVAFTLVSLGSFGLGAGFYGRHPEGRRLLMRHLVMAGVIASFMVLAALVVSGQAVDLLDPAYRLKIAGNFYAFVVRPAAVSLLLIGATYILRLRRPRLSDLLFVLVLILAIFVFKTRAPVFYGLISIGILYAIYRTGVHERIVQFGLTIVGIVGIVIVYFSGVLATLLLYLTRGDLELTLQLTGRLSLWEVLVQAVKEKPLGGAGFGAYWNPGNYYSVWNSLEDLTAVDAHNGFLEELLATGIIGLILLLSFLSYGVFVAFREARRGERFAWIAVMLLTYYLLVNFTTSITQSYMEIPFIAIFAILGLLSVRRSGQRHKSEKPRSHFDQHYARR